MTCNRKLMCQKGVPHKSLFLPFADLLSHATQFPPWLSHQTGLSDLFFMFLSERYECLLLPPLHYGTQVLKLVDVVK